MDDSDYIFYVADYAMLAKGVEPGIRVVVLVPNSDGMTQITDDSIAARYV
ncbi:hypothetical protein [Nostoc sp.]